MRTKRCIMAVLTVLIALGCFSMLPACVTVHDHPDHDRVIVHDDHDHDRVIEEHHDEHIERN